MITFDVELDMGPWRTSLRALREGLDDELERCVDWSGKEIALQARRGHAYVDRSGFLTRSLSEIGPFGKFLDDTLDGGAIDTAPYASYIEDGTLRGIKPYKFLVTAEYFAREGMQEHLVDAVEAAVKRAGL